MNIPTTKNTTLYIRDGINFIGSAETALSIQKQMARAAQRVAEKRPSPSK